MTLPMYRPISAFRRLDSHPSGMYELIFAMMDYSYKTQFLSGSYS